MNRIKQWLELGDKPLALHDWLLVMMPFFLFFSYHPIIPVASGEYKTHYEFSLTELYLVLYVLAVLPMLWRARRELLNHTAARYVIVFAAYALLSTVWSPDRVRGLVTAGLVWVLGLVFFSFR